MANILLIGGLGHTDLSGRVPRPGLLMLRQALRRAGHKCTVTNYSASLMPKLFPRQFVDQLAGIYQRSIRPAVMGNQHPLLKLLKLPILLRDISRLEKLSRQLKAQESEVFAELGLEIADQIEQEGYDAVGFSLYLGSSTVASMTIADILRGRHPQLPIFFGGPQTTHFAETIYRETHAPTALVRGEGELSLVGLAGVIDQLKAGDLTVLSDIPNLVFRNEQGRIFTTARQRLSLDDWVKLSAVPYEETDFNGLMKYAFIETSRGCFWRCHFCAQPLISGTKRLLKPANKIVDEMVELSERFGIDHFELVGSSTPPAQAEYLSDEIMRRGLQNRFNWVLFMRGQDERIDQAPLPDLMQKIRQAGGSAIFFGVEAADNPTLERMGKKARIEEIEKAMAAAKQADIFTIGSFIYPYPGMPANEADLIVEFLKKVRPDSAPVQALGLFPGTHDYINAKAKGCTFIRPNDNQVTDGRDPELLSYLLKYPLTLSLPMRLWAPLPYRIDGRDYSAYVRLVNQLQTRINELGILTGLSHSHFLIAQASGLTPREFAERLFYTTLTGDPAETARLIERFNRSAAA
ncbi:MAG: B12-binding domain-containing radical SAM protein [Candidatus Saganbacteria bacterium]|nr:B12-binding domain-containing radical SAM protein [Candidatus Saganbacteria bacterium]